MPRKTDALPIGTAPCMACGADNKVYQNSKKYLYMRGCPGCGSADQRISDLVQITLFYTLKTGEGALVERPRNVPETRPEWLDKKPEIPAPVPAPVPTAVPMPVPTPTPQKRGGGKGAAIIIASVIGLLLALAGVASSNTTTAST